MTPPSIYVRFRSASGRQWQRALATLSNDELRLLANDVLQELAKRDGGRVVRHRDGAQEVKGPKRCRCGGEPSPGNHLCDACIRQSIDRQRERERPGVSISR